MDYVIHRNSLSMTTETSSRETTIPIQVIWRGSSTCFPNQIRVGECITNIMDDRGPWNRERIWLPYRCDEKTTAVQPASILPPVANLADGPSGFVAYPGTGLPAQYNNHFFLADFYGTPALSGIRSFAVEKYVVRDSRYKTASGSSKASLQQMSTLDLTGACMSLTG